MGANILDGKKIAKEIRENIRQEVHQLKEKQGIVPGLAVIVVGDDDASHLYVSMKEKACHEAGIYSEAYKLPSTITQEELLRLIDTLNESEKIHGILVQLPLPSSIDEKTVNDRIIPNKDIDGFHAVNNGKLVLGEPGFVPCTPKGMVELIKRTGELIEGKHAVVIGRSNIVGKPAALLLLRENATVTICHSKTADLSSHVKTADIVVSAVGIPHFITGDMIKEGAIVIDAGTRVVDGKLVGDVTFDTAKEVASWITPVPGGVGPMTIAMLLKNTLKAAQL